MLYGNSEHDPPRIKRPLASSVRASSGINGAGTEAQCALQLEVTAEAWGTATKYRHPRPAAPRASPPSLIANSASAVMERLPALTDAPDARAKSFFARSDPQRLCSPFLPQPPHAPPQRPDLLPFAFATTNGRYTPAPRARACSLRAPAAICDPTRSKSLVDSARPRAMTKLLVARRQTPSQCGVQFARSSAACDSSTRWRGEERMDVVMAALRSAEGAGWLVLESRGREGGEDAL
ncbi:hypothetical protein MSAN_00777400 [Mycena sanguinolenta]|uniref:Uncharacterized protein n=1 Tax=Mycena sanguinolenta TaxID=230812 RepID=A0A8H6Z344_9AGAR|nr:hypothetical protein MSAN_00777400 [Mycena sanguinolenta]